MADFIWNVASGECASILCFLYLSLNSVRGDHKVLANRLGPNFHSLALQKE